MGSKGARTSPLENNNLARLFESRNLRLKCFGTRCSTFPRNPHRSSLIEGTVPSDRSSTFERYEDEGHSTSHPKEYCFQILRHRGDCICHHWRTSVSELFGFGRWLFRNRFGDLWHCAHYWRHCQCCEPALNPRSIAILKPFATPLLQVFDFSFLPGSDALAKLPQLGMLWHVTGSSCRIQRLCERTTVHERIAAPCRR